MDFLCYRPGVWLVLLGIGGFFVFAKWETTVKMPVLDFMLFRKNKVFAFANLGALINFSATHAVTFLLSLYLQYIKGLSPQNTGLILVAQPVVQAIFSSMAGRLSDKIAPQKVSSSGITLTVVGLLLFTRLTETTSIAFIIASLVILGLGSTLFASPNTNVVMGSVTPKVYGVASGTRGDDAADWTDAQHGHYYAIIYNIHGARSDYSRVKPLIHAECALRLHHFCDSVCRWDICVVGKRYGTAQ